jgi:hypothetical protein
MFFKILTFLYKIDFFIENDIPSDNNDILSDNNDILSDNNDILSDNNDLDSQAISVLDV